MLRILIVLVAPAVAFCAGGVKDVGPLFGGPRAIAVGSLHEYPRGQEVVLEVHATSDLPGAERVFLGRTRTVVAGPDAKFAASGTQIIALISEPLPDTRKEWKLQVWYSPKPGDDANSRLYEHTAPRKFPVRKK